MAFHYYMSLIYILPALFFICVVLTFKLRAQRRNKEADTSQDSLNS